MITQLATVGSQSISTKVGTDKGVTHSYLGVYDTLLEKYRDTATNVLEIGISGGYSHILWSRFFTKAQIYGVDISPIPTNLAAHRNITAYRGDAYNLNFIQEKFSSQGIKFDVIIDDGPHTLESMIFAAEHYSKLLTDTGILIIEDVASIDWAAPIFNKFPAQTGKIASLIDLRSVKNRYDDIMIVFSANNYSNLSARSPLISVNKPAIKSKRSIVKIRR